MKLKGNYDSSASYDVGDVVVYDGDVYIKEHEGEMPGDPKDPHIWNKPHQIIADAVLLMMDTLEMAKDEVEKYFLNDQTLVLKAGEGDEEKSYAITVDASGDTPELAVEEISEEA